LDEWPRAAIAKNRTLIESACASSALVQGHSGFRDTADILMGGVPSVWTIKQWRRLK